VNRPRRRPLAADPGGMGITRDTVVERIFRDTRAFRIYDGPSEVHRWALGSRIVGGKM
jgi:acyl-CoA dehydrogenase